MPERGKNLHVHPDLLLCQRAGIRLLFLSHDHHLLIRQPQEMPELEEFRAKK